MTNRLCGMISEMPHGIGTRRSYWSTLTDALSCSGQRRLPRGTYVSHGLSTTTWLSGGKHGSRDTIAAGGIGYRRKNVRGVKCVHNLFGCRTLTRPSSFCILHQMLWLTLHPGCKIFWCCSKKIRHQSFSRVEFCVKQGVQTA